MPRGWFGPKRIGFGVGPRSWEGWAVSVLLLVAVALTARFVAPALADALDAPRALVVGVCISALVALYGLVIWRTYDSQK